MQTEAVIMSVDDAFLKDLAETPNEATLRRVFADWCDDFGRPSDAECLRWAAANNKRPYSGSSTGTKSTWFNGDQIAVDLGDPESDLPGPLFLKLEGGTPVANHRAYATSQEAERALFAAWTDARKEGWDPTKVAEKKEEKKKEDE